MRARTESLIGSRVRRWFWRYYRPLRRGFGPCPDCGSRTCGGTPDAEIFGGVR